jgi:hypothetical protein
MTKPTSAQEGLAALSITTFFVLVLAGSAAFAQVAPVKVEHGLLQGVDCSLFFQGHALEP